MNTSNKTTLIISKMAAKGSPTRLYWNGQNFMPTYLEAGIIGMTPKYVTRLQYLALRKANPQLFENSALLNKREMCVESISTCEASFNDYKG